MANVLLPCVGVVAIVKDEITNEAGGISSFVQRCMDLAACLYVTDTGSTDGTLEMLEAWQLRFPNRVFVQRSSFEGFAQARNQSFEFAMSARLDSIKYFLILDADEEMDLQSICMLQSYLDSDKGGPALDGRCCKVGIRTVSSENKGIYRGNSGLLNPRLFPAISGFSFRNEIDNRFERLLYNGEALPKSAYMDICPCPTIVHYISPRWKIRRKKNFDRKNECT